MNFFRFLKSKSFLVQIAFAVAGIFLLVFVLKWWLGFTTNHKQKIQVPDLNKMSLTEVGTTLKELNLDFIVIDSASYNPNYPKKSVIDQTPKFGDMIACSWSPAPVIVSKSIISTNLLTAVSDCPTPTVSTIITS